MENLKNNEMLMKKGVAVMVMTSLFLSVMLTTSMAQRPMTREAMVAKINSVRQQVDNLAMKGSSIEEASKFFTDDYIMMEPNKPTFNGKKAYLQRVESLVKSGVKINSVKRNVIDVWQSGNRIYEIGTAEFQLTLPRATEPIVDPTGYFTIWETQADGSMQMKYSIWNTQSKMLVE